MIHLIESTEMKEEKIERRDLMGYFLYFFIGLIMGTLLAPMGDWIEGYLWGWLFLICYSLGLAFYSCRKKKRRHLRQASFLILLAPLILIAMLIVTIG